MGGRVPAIRASTMGAKMAGTAADMTMRGQRPPPSGAFISPHVLTSVRAWGARLPYTPGWDRQCKSWMAGRRLLHPASQHAPARDAVTGRAKGGLAPLLPGRSRCAGPMFPRPSGRTHRALPVSAPGRFVPSPGGRTGYRPRSPPTGSPASPSARRRRSCSATAHPGPAAEA